MSTQNMKVVFFGEFNSSIIPDSMIESRDTTAGGVGGAAAGAAVGSFLGPLGALAGAFIGSIVGEEAVVDSFEEIEEKREKKFQELKGKLENDSTVSFVVESYENKEHYRFEPNHRVERNSFYFEHLQFPNHLLPLSQYTLHLYEQKMRVLKLLVEALGAKSLKLENVEVRSHEESDSGGIDYKQIASFAGISATFEGTYMKKSNAKKYGLPRYQPFVPEEATLWCSFEPTFRSLKESRLRSNLIEETISVELNERSSQASQLFLDVMGLGIHVGTQTARRHSSEWTFEVQFFSNQELAHLPKYSSQKSRNSKRRNKRR